MYLFVYDDPKENVCIKGLCNPIKKITVLHSGKELAHEIHGACLGSISRDDVD